LGDGEISRRVIAQVKIIRETAPYIFGDHWIARTPEGVVMSVDPNKVYLVIEAAEILRCGKTNAYELIASGDLASTKIGAGRKGIRVMGSDILAFLESRREGGPKPQGSLKYLKIRR
jgi:excisionase family DNA binding protein